MRTMPFLSFSTDCFCHARISVFSCSHSCLYVLSASSYPSIFSLYSCIFSAVGMFVGVLSFVCSNLPSVLNPILY